MKQLPWLSVIMPTYNGEKFVATALDSIEMQGDTGIECIVVDDGSTDNTESIVTSYSNRLNIRFIRGPRRGNWVAGTNDGLRLGRARHACFLHQDDYWLPDRIAVLKSLIARYPDASMYLHPVRYVNASGCDLGPWSAPLPQTPLQVQSRLFGERLIVQNFLAVNAPTFVRQDALDIGGLDESLWYTADWDLWLKLSQRGPSVYCRQFLAAFRLHPDSQTVMGVSRMQTFSTQIDSVLDRHAQVMGTLSSEVMDRARVSAEINVALARGLRGSRWPVFCLLFHLLLKGPRYCHSLLRDSRLHQRVSARLRANLARSGPAS